MSPHARPCRAAPASHGLPALAVESTGLAGVAEGLRGAGGLGVDRHCCRADVVVVNRLPAFPMAIPIWDTLPTDADCACRLVVRLAGGGNQKGKRTKGGSGDDRKLRGRVIYGWQYHADGTRLPNAQPPGPASLQKPLGVDFFTEVTKVYLGDADVRDITDAQMERLKCLTQLDALYVRSRRVTDAGAKCIAEMPRLKELFLCDTEVTDAVLESIEHFTQLELLFLRSAKITDAGLNRLKGLVLLRRLYLGGTQVSDAGLENLKGLTRLDTLELRGTRVTDAVLENIKGLSHLRIFDLSATRITDAGLQKHLKVLAELETLNLDNTQVTDGGLEHLKDLINLRVLELAGSQVTYAGVEKLRQALPNCRIESSAIPSLIYTPAP